MIEERDSVIAGFPAFWQQVYGDYPLFFEAAKQLEPIQNKLFRKPVTERLHIVLRWIARSVSNSFGALIALVLNGYGADAMRIARSMFEGELIAAYLQRHPETLDDYVDFCRIQQKKIYDYMVQFAPELVKRVPSKRIAAMQREFAPAARRGSIRNRWAPTSIREMAQEAGLEELYLTFYLWASSIHHFDVFGMFCQVPHRDSDIEVAPSQQWLSAALVVGCGSVVRALKCYNEVAQLGMDKKLGLAQQAFMTAMTALRN